MPRQWTEEQRKAQGERLKLARAAKKAKANGEVQVAINPVANDVVEPTPIRKPLPKPKPPEPKPSPDPVVPAGLITGLIRELETIPLGSVSFAECGALLNALSACSTAVALARRQKQEQLEAGTHRAPCKTCGRMIDISKAGGFQILTERDEHHMPKNTYYCSQNCLLARNMPSHARQTSKEKKENRA